MTMVFERVRDEGLLASGRSVLVMLSGGRDSTCLADLAVRIAGAGFVRALHVNYGLRDESSADERWCSELCERLQIPLALRRAVRPETGNLQAWARDERYGAAAQIALAWPADVAVGHTATDQVETVLYRLASSPSRRALLGMHPRQGSLIRPLLAFTREQTATYCRERGLTWREDETNGSRAYARGRVRGGLVPALKEIHPAAEQNVLALLEVLRDEAAVLEELVDETLGGVEQIELKRLRGLSPALRRLVVQRLADGAAGRPAPGTARRADEIAALSDHAALDLPHGIRAEVRLGTLRLLRRNATVPSAEHPHQQASAARP
ncbi:MAG TPA: tRNA lysidine(34) synthetase TilS [Solirubrobacteraceae bacterium]